MTPAVDSAIYTRDERPDRDPRRESRLMRSIAECETAHAALTQVEIKIKNGAEPETVLGEVRSLVREEIERLQKSLRGAPA